LIGRRIYLFCTIFLEIMPKLVTQTQIHLGPQGRLVIPAPLRRSLGFESGDSLIARMENGGLVLEKARMTKERLKNRFARLPSTTSLAEELIKERREAAKREASEWASCWAPRLCWASCKTNPAAIRWKRFFPKLHFQRQLV
jgi:AbrB family looped-hinge helix DNA binding protein